MESTVKTDFGIMCRELRVQKGLKQREVAEFIGVKLSTYGNVESAPHRVIREEKAARIAELYHLDPVRRAALILAWARTPLSEYSEKQRASWRRRSAYRSKAAGYDRLQASLVEMVSFVLAVAPAGQLCTCGLDGKSESDSTRACELCTALEALGLPAFTTAEDATAQIAALHDKLHAEAS